MESNRAKQTMMTGSGLAPEPQERIRRWGAVLWPSFLIAGIATMVFFANIDPEELRSATFPYLEISRKLGYTIGFFMFWGATAWSSFLTMALLSPPTDRQRIPESHDARR